MDWMIIAREYFPQATQWQLQDFCWQAPNWYILSGDREELFRQHLAKCLSANGCDIKHSLKRK